MSDIVISVEGLYKKYRLGVIGSGLLYKDMQSWIARVLGKADPNLSIDQLDKYAKNGHKNEPFWALKDISLNAKKGDVLGIIGKNGAGKTTLLKIISRITAPTRGVVKIKGRIASLLEVGTGFHPELTGKENIYLNGTILGMKKREIKGKLDEIISFAEIEKFIDTPVKRYSSGMYVRLAFAIAAHLDPEILIVDEVLAVGDAEFQKKCLGKMKEVSNEGRTVLFVSHNMAAINSLCTSCLLLDSGSIQALGEPDKITNLYLNGPDSVNKSVFEWKNSSDRPGDDVAVLNSIRLINENGDLQKNIKVNQKVGIEMNYEIIKDGSKPLPVMQLFTSEGEKIFGSIPADRNEYSFTKGVYKSIMWIPANFLNAISYYISFGVVTWNPMNIHFLLDKSLFFDVLDDLNSITKPDTNQILRGAIRPLLEWKTQIVD